MGIVKVAVSGLPMLYEESGVTYVFKVEHDPEDHNYCHCEIRLYKNGHRLTKDELGKAKALKKHYRDALYKTATLFLRPEVATGHISGPSAAN
jgi:hypothetical protein